MGGGKFKETIMNKSLIIGDIHIEEKAIPELTGIFKEILKIKADRFVQLGDFFEHNRPTPAELKFATSIVKKLKKKFKDVTIISGTGNHDLLHDVSIIEFLKELGINSVKGDFVRDNIRFGHYMLHSSKLEYGTGKCGVKDLAKYDFVFLGHQHLFQELKKDKIYHPGSIRWQHFNEVDDKFKRVILLEDGKIKFIPLKSPYPMLDIHSVKELPNIIPGKIQIRLVINSFDQFKKEVNEINKWKHKFNVFKVKLNFTNTIAKPEKTITQSKKLKEILIEGIKKVKDKEVQILLREILDEK